MGPVEAHTYKLVAKNQFSDTCGLCKTVLSRLTQAGANLDRSCLFLVVLFTANTVKLQCWLGAACLSSRDLCRVLFFLFFFWLNSVLNWDPRPRNVVRLLNKHFKLLPKKPYSSMSPPRKCKSLAKVKYPHVCLIKTSSLYTVTSNLCISSTKNKYAKDRTAHPSRLKKS